jgi:tetratricopeptide (TPR) repeat protein
VIASAWQRIPRLAEQWAVVARHESERAHADAARALFQSVHPFFDNGGMDVDRGTWLLPYADSDAPTEETAYSQIYDYLTYLSALMLVPTPQIQERWVEPEALPADAAHRLMSASAMLEQLAAPSPLSCTMQAVLAWCTYARGVRSNENGLLALAAERFLAVPPHPTAQSSGDDLQRILGAAAGCYERAGRLTEAEETLQRWTQEFPNDPEAWRRLATVRGRAGAYDEALDAFETFARLSPAAEADWQATLLLKLGFELKTVTSKRQTLPEATPEFGNALLGWTWPNFQQLSPRARERWWAGLAHVCVPEVSRILGPAFRAVGGSCFGEAVAAELRDWVVFPLAEHLGNQSHWANLRDDSMGADRIVAKGLERGQLALGQQIKLFQMAKAPKTRLAEAVAPWIRKNRGLLLNHITSPQTSKAVEELVNSRNLSVHDDIGDEHLRTLYDTARGLLDVVCQERRSKKRF